MWAGAANPGYVGNLFFLVLWGCSSIEAHEKERMRKLRRKQRDGVEKSKSEESISRETSSLRSAEEMEEEKYEGNAFSITEDVGVSQQEKSVLSDEIDELKEDSIQGVEEMQVEGDSSLKPSQNQADVMVQEEQEEETEEEEEEEEENTEEEEKEEHESLSMVEVGQE